MTGSLVQIRDNEDPLRSDVTLLIAALLTLGIPAAGGELFYSTCEAVRGEVKFESVWSLRGISRDGRFDTVRMRQCWADAPWLLANPSHPMSVMRCGLTYHRAFSYSPRFTLTELANLETPDTWLEAAIRNLIFILRELPAVPPRGTVRFGPDWAAFVPRNLPDDRRTRFLKYVETQDPTKRRSIARS